MTGPAIGRPKSATFRTMDIAGIDVLAHVARNLSERLESPEDRAIFAVPPLVETMVERGWIGAKAGQGFYKKDASGEILTLDPTTMEYRPKQPARLPSLEAARSIEDVAERVRTLMKGEDKVGRFLRATLAPTLDYAGRVAPADRARARRHRSGDALGVRMGARAVRAQRHRLRARHAARRRESEPRRRPQERRREPGRPRRRRAVRRVPFEDERHRRRHDPDAAGRREGSQRELRRPRRRQRRAPLLRRREPDAAAARGAGGATGTRWT